MGTVPTISGVFCTSSWRKKRVFPELERSMMASAPKRSAVATFSHSTAASATSPEMPRFTLTFVERPSPTPAGLRPAARCRTLAGMAMRPAATPARMNSGSRCSTSATARMASVMTPARAKSICVTSLWAVSPPVPDAVVAVCGASIRMLPSLALPMSGSTSRGGRAPSQPAAALASAARYRVRPRLRSCKLPVMFRRAACTPPRPEAHYTLARAARADRVWPIGRGGSLSGLYLGSRQSCSHCEHLQSNRFLQWRECLRGVCHEGWGFV